jgi:hypothetical protein
MAKFKFFTSGDHYAILFLIFFRFFVQYADMSRHTIFTLFGLVMCMDWVRMHLEVGLKQVFC